MKKWWAAIGFVAILTASAWTDRMPGETVPGASQSDTPGILNASPIDLFEGNAAKLRPFLGPMSGAVQLRYRGDKHWIEAAAEIWEDGVRKSTVGNLRLTLLDGKGFDGDFAVSVNDQPIDGKQTQTVVTYAFTEGGGYSSGTFTLSEDPRLKLKGTLSHPHQVAVPESEGMLVWGIQATDQNGMSTVALDDQSLKGTRWAMVFRISLGG